MCGKMKSYPLLGIFLYSFPIFFFFGSFKRKRNKNLSFNVSVFSMNMNEQQFYTAVTLKAKELNMSPLLLISGIEGLYSFKDVEIDNINYRFLDNLIITILALRIGDSFHAIAEENLSSSNDELRKSADSELRELTN